MKNEFLEWQALEHQWREKTSDWFWVVGIVAVSLAVAAILFRNFLFSILIIIAAVALVLQAARKPRLLRFEINSSNILAGNVRYPMSSLEAFWLDQADPANNKLLLKSKSLTAMLIIIPLGDVDSSVVGGFLKDYLKEEELHEPLGQKIMEALGF